MDIIIFDWKRTLYDPDNKELISGVLDLLEYIKSQNIQMVLVGKGGEDMQGEVNRLGVKNYFKHIVFAQGEKDPEVFASHMTQDPKKTVIIGDRVRSELKIGKSLGAITIWIKQGKFAAEEPENEEQEPDYIVNSLGECLINLLKTKFYGQG